MISTKTLWERCKELGEKKTQLQDVILIFEHDEYIFLHGAFVLARVAEKSVQGSQWLAEAILTKFEGEAMIDKFAAALRETQQKKPVVVYQDAKDAGPTDLQSILEELGQIKSISRTILARVDSSRKL